MLIQAVLSAEDRDFYEHNGVDPVGIARAAWTNLRQQDVVQGGSSITQQYVKTVFLTDERTYERKIKEAVLAIKLERELTKQQILLRYLNTIYFGRGAYGVQAASRAYFGKDVQQIGLPEAAYLAALIRSPESADALLGTDDALAAEERATADARRRSVLDAMVEEEYITPEEAAAAADDALRRALPAAPRARARTSARCATPRWAPSTSSSTCAASSARRPATATPRSTAVACASTRRSTTTCSAWRTRRSPPT